MKLHVLMVLTAGLLLTTGSLADDPVKNDRARLQGTWSIVSLEVNGKAEDVSKLQEARLRIEGERYSFKLGDMRLEMTHKVDPGKKPKPLDLTVTEGPTKGKTYRAIYELTQDTLKICRHVEPDKERPTAFASRPDSGLMVIVWKRAKP